MKPQPLSQLLTYDDLFSLFKFMRDDAIPISAIKSLALFFTKLFLIIKAQSLSHLLLYNDMLLLFKLMKDYSIPKSALLNKD